MLSIIEIAIPGAMFVLLIGSLLLIEVRYLNDVYSKKDADRFAEGIENPKILGFAVLGGDHNKHFPDDAWIRMVDAVNPDMDVDVVVLSLRDRSWRPRTPDVAIGANYVYAIKHCGKSIMYRSRRSRHHSKLFGPIIRDE